MPIKLHSGLNEDSYHDFKLCAEELQSHLFQGELLECLSNLRGFRRLFSQSRDPVLRHAFRGRPLEVLQNIYYPAHQKHNLINSLTLDQVSRGKCLGRG